MNSGSPLGSAKIYQFPVGGRASFDGNRKPVQSAADLPSVRAPKIAFGSGWYHEAAIQDAEEALEH